jgi:hypothetical protein
VAWYVYLLSDLLDGRVAGGHKTWLFLNTFFMNAEQRKRIRRTVCGRGRTIIWMYAPGFQSPQGLSTAGIRELTGMDVRLLPAAASGQVTLTDFADPITRGIAEFGPHALLGARDIDDKESILEPLFYIDDPKAKVLGRLEAINQPGLAVRRFADWTSIYAATSQLNEVLLRNICRAAGTHLYCRTGDVIYVHPRLIALTARTAGRKTIDLPKVRRVRDALTGTSRAASTRRIEFHARVNETHLFEIE